MEIDQDVKKFIGEVVESLVMWELLVFLWKNPGIADNAEGVSGRIGRRSKDMAGPLEILVKRRVLNKWGDKADPVYAYNPSPKLAKTIEKFVGLNNDKEGKLVIWSQLLKKGVR
ncbi:hypothetical protein KAR10_04460 [bacterium]|nr:hypothetical protein [bacterium]